MKSEGEDFVLVDVREQDEYDTCNLGGQLIPLSSLAEGMKQLDRYMHIVVHCKVAWATGWRSTFRRSDG